MRGARHVGFSAIILKINSRISWVTGLRPRFTHARDQPPIELKAGSVPAHHGIRRHDNESCFPARPEATKKHPKNLICDDQLGARIPAFENRELLTQSKVLDEEPLLRAKQSNK